MLYYVYKTNNTLVLAVYVAVIYFLFLICICILTVVLTVIVHHLYLRSETKPFTPMPAWVSMITVYIQLDYTVSFSVLY